MSDPLSRTRNWWASSRQSSRRAAIGGVALFSSLGLISAFVWTSPDISPVTVVADAAEDLTRHQALVEERANLLDQVVSLKADLTAITEQLSSAKGASSDADAQIAALEAQISDLQTQLATAPGTDAGSGSGAGTAAAKPSTTTPSKPAATTTPVTAPSKAEILAPSSPYFGMYTEQAPFNWATFDAAATKIGAKQSLVGYFGGWDQTFRADAVTRSWSRGMMPMLTWESRPIADNNDVTDRPEYSLPTIIGGSHDDYLRQYARDIVANGLPLAIRLDHEMNSIWYPWAEDDGKGNSINGNNPGDYVKMWQHVHDVFQEEGANDLVVWVWAPNRIDRLTSTHRTLEYLTSLYPGDGYVDWVGMSGYLRPPYDEGSYGFDQTFGATLDQIRTIAPDKPIILAEVGASETGGRKAAWITDFFAGLEREENADIIGFAWFDLAVTTYVQGELATNDWRVDSRSDSLAAFREGLLGDGTRFQLEPTG